MTGTRTPMAAVLARIMGEVGRVEKKGRITSKGDGPSYKFAKDSDVLEAVTPKMAEAGIVMVPEHTELLSIEPSLSGRQLIANIKSSWHVTDGTDSLRFETLGQGADSGDKALPKAQSNARKYAFFMLYHIVTGDDPDQHASDIEQPGQGAQATRRAASTVATRPIAPAPAQYRRGELADLASAKGLDHNAIQVYADLVGIEKGARATDAQMDALIAAVKGHGTTEPLELPLDEPDLPEVAAVTA